MWRLRTILWIAVGILLAHELRAEWSVEPVPLPPLPGSLTASPPLVVRGDGAVVSADISNSHLRLQGITPEGATFSSTGETVPWDFMRGAVLACALGSDTLAVTMTGRDGDDDFDTRLLFFNGALTRFASVWMIDSTSDVPAKLVPAGSAVALTGVSEAAGDPRFFAARYLPEGIGWFQRDEHTSLVSRGSGIAVDALGNLYFSGTVQSPTQTQPQLLLARYTAAGAQSSFWSTESIDSTQGVDLAMDLDGERFGVVGIGPTQGASLFLGWEEIAGDSTSFHSLARPCAGAVPALLSPMPGRMVTTMGSLEQGCTLILAFDDQGDTSTVAELPLGGSLLARASGGGFVVAGEGIARFGPNGTEYWRQPTPAPVQSIVQANDSTWYFCTTSSEDGGPPYSVQVTSLQESFTNAPPSPFTPLLPENGATLAWADSTEIRLVWRSSDDPDPDAVVSYALALQVARVNRPDTLFTVPDLADSSFGLLAIAAHTGLPTSALRGVTWSVSASSQGDTVSSGAPWSFTLGSSFARERPGLLPLTQGGLIYPNPTNGAVQIRFLLAQPGDVELEVSNLLGRVVHREWFTGVMPGEQTLTWRAEVASGSYYLRLLQPGRKPLLSRRLLVVR